MPPTKEQILAFVSSFSLEEGTVLLLSGGDFSTAERSYIGLFPRKIITIEANPSENPWEVLSNRVREGFWFGYLSYEMGHWSVPKQLKYYRNKGEALAEFVFCAAIIVIDHKEGSVEIKYQDELTQCEKQRVKPFLNGEYASKKILASKLSLSGSIISLKEYQKKISEILDWIINGHVYQVNLSHSVEWHGVLDPFATFCQLFESNPPPFSAYMHFNSRTIASLSPERFIQLKNGILSSTPIKGTCPRGATSQEDLENKNYLLSSSKENAELLMITDLMRNDLGKVCLPGSVKVPQVVNCETYENVFHLNSLIQGNVDPSKNYWEIIAACFPAGSITGCPKGRAMELINILEQSTRGIYTGSIGYVDFQNGFDFNVAIRTADISGNSVKVRLGGGITIDSLPHKEYQETLHKGQTFFKVLGIH